MPRIPRAYAEAPYPGRPVSPERATVVEREITRAGEKISAVGDFVARKELEAERTEKALRIENQMNQDFGDLAESYNNRIDYENFQPDLDKFLTEKKAQYGEFAGNDRELNFAIERAFSNRAAQIALMVSNKKRQVMVESGLGQFAAVKRSDLEAYANALDDETRAQVKADFVNRGQLMVQNGFMRNVDFQKELIDFGNEAAQLRIEKIGRVNPQTALDLLSSGGEPDLDPKARQDLIDKMVVAKKVKQIEDNRIEKEMHDNEERQVGDYFITGNYTAAFEIVRKSTLLSGSEKASWARAIKSILKNPEPTDNEQALEIVKINGMVSDGEDPQKIRNYILQSPNLKKEDKEQYINKLETKLGQEIEDGRRAAYRDIQDIIIPKRGMLAAILETQKETIAVKNAQMALDDWLDQQKKDQKYPSKNEIRRKAMELGEAYQVPIAERLEEEEEGAKRAAEETKKYLKQKKLREKK